MREHSFEHQLPNLHGNLHTRAQLAAGGEKEQVGRADAINGSYECRRDTLADRFDIGQVLHHVNQADDRADDSDGGRITAGGLVHFGLCFALVLDQRRGRVP